MFIKCWEVAGALHRPKGIMLLKMAILANEGSFPLITPTNMKQNISPSQIQFSKPVHPLQMLQQLRNERQGVLVLDGNTIQSPIVHTSSSLHLSSLQKIPPLEPPEPAVTLAVEGEGQGGGKKLTPNIPG